MTQAELIETWWTESAEIEQGMEDQHGPQWRQIIRLMIEHDIFDKTVLDFGCNQGGFLRMLFHHKPFRHGIGVDIARESIEAARRQSGRFPLEYFATTTLKSLSQLIDIAFSNEVVYLLPDMAAHAEEIWSVLKPGGVYYLANSCHTDNPLWARWKELIDAEAAVKSQDYSLNDIGDAFLAQGFSVTAKPFRPDDFIAYRPSDQWVPSMTDMFEYYYGSKVLFRLTKPS